MIVRVWNIPASATCPSAPLTLEGGLLRVSSEGRWCPARWVSACAPSPSGTEVTSESGHLRYPDTTREAHGHSAGHAHHSDNSLRSLKRPRQPNRRPSHRPNHLV